MEVRHGITAFRESPLTDHRSRPLAPDRPLRYHFSGVAGAGMNPLARLMRARGHAVQGSDRSFDQGLNRELAERLAALGIALGPQDGSVVTPDLDRFVYSTAVEAETPEFRAARAHGIELVPRPALLAEVVNAGRPGVAVAGTSGKSTVTGMLAWLTREAGLGATALGGAALVGDGVSGCFLAGPADGPVLAEACESDGTLAGYHPAVGLVHNISRDHGEVDALRPQFEAFARQSGRVFLNADSPGAAALRRAVQALTYGTAPHADVRLEIRGAGPHRAAGALHLPGGTVALDIPQPGRHNLDNAAAAVLLACELGIPGDQAAALLARFPGVARRFEVIGAAAGGIRVVDDYAHNGEKLRAAITTAQAGAPRVLAVFQPHGYGPARFLRPELQELLPRLLRPVDRFCYAEIFYAGGTVARDVSSRLLAADLPATMQCGYAADHAAVVDWVRSEAQPGDTVLIMGARDPELPALARRLFAALGGTALGSLLTPSGTTR
jgi:UDP-N-acetylmuramate--alanine ligase